MKMKPNDRMRNKLTGAETHADTFGTGPNQFTMDSVNIGHAGNKIDTTGYGAVADNDRIGKYEVTIDQFKKTCDADTRISNGG